MILKSCSALLVLFTAASALAQEMAPNPWITGESKGTIGLVCTDSKGQVHYWNSQRFARENDVTDSRTDFEACLDEIVSAWTLKNASTCPADLADGCDPATEPGQLIRGFTAYRKAVDTASRLKK